MRSNHKPSEGGNGLTIERRRCGLFIGFGVTCLLFLPSAYSASHYQMLKSFGFSDLTAQNPYAPLIEGSDGALYGTTCNGGLGKRGTVIKMAKDGGNERVLHHFITTSSDGQLPEAGLLLGTNGWLYGTTSEGGSNGFGTIFYLLEDGSGYAVAHHFGVLFGDGRYPQAGLIQASDGTLYGTT